MHNDYFLMHRALQIQQLRAAQTGNRLDLPARLGSSKGVVQLCRTIDAICGWDFEDKPKSERLAWLKSLARRLFSKKPAADDQDAAGADPADKPLLAPDQRQTINDLETSLVRARLGDDSSAADVAASVMETLWRDAAFFNGVKPLAVHTDLFAYEFLYPTWFNLYTVLSAAGQPDAKFSAAQVKTVFRFLEAHERGGAQRDGELLGLLTFIANRFPAAEAHDLTQRLIDVCCWPESDLATAATATIRPFRELTRAMADFRQLVRDYLTVERCRHQGTLQARYQVVPKGAPRPALPAAVQTALCQLKRDFRRDQGYTKFVHGVARIVTAAGGFAPEFEELLDRNETCAVELVGLAAPPEQAARPLSVGGQRLLARLAAKEQARTRTLDVARVQPFARVLAPRIDPLSEGLEHVLAAEFIDDDAGRQAFLDCADDPEKRKPIAARLTAAAKAAEDREQFFYLLELAAILDPAYPDESVQKIRCSAQVLRLAMENGTIVSTQLADLVSDLQEHLPDSLRFLETPGRHAQYQEARLKNLYLTLRDEREVYTRTGQIGNFAVTHAAYRRSK